MSFDLQKKAVMVRNSFGEIQLEKKPLLGVQA
jgi:hypothetical protein